MNIFLDACILIYWVESKEPYYSNFIDAIKELNESYPNNTLFASRLSYLECVTKPMQIKDSALVQQYESIFSNDIIKIVELTETCIKLATQLRIKYKLKTPDALQLGAALSLDDPIIFLTNNTSLKSVKEIKIKTIGKEFNV